MEVIFSLQELDTTARQFLSQLNGPRVVAFHGEMGAGKTTLIHALCQAMGVTDTVSSPTFSIINQYRSASGEIIQHIDLYRLKDEEEAIQAGVEDCLYSGNTCFVEWPLRAPGILPGDTLHVYLTALDTNTRKLEIK